jgi:hypothetical protein
MILGAVGWAGQFDAFGSAINSTTSRKLTTIVREIDLCFCAAFEIRVQKRSCFLRRRISFQVNSVDIPRLGSCQTASASCPLLGSNSNSASP